MKIKLALITAFMLYGAAFAMDQKQNNNEQKLNEYIKSIDPQKQTKAFCYICRQFKSDNLVEPWVMVKPCGCPFHVNCIAQWGSVAPESQAHLCPHPKHSGTEKPYTLPKNIQCQLDEDTTSKLMERGILPVSDELKNAKYWHDVKEKNILGDYAREEEPSDYLRTASWTYFFLELALLITHNSDTLDAFAPISKTLISCAIGAYGVAEIIDQYNEYPHNRFQLRLRRNARSALDGFWLSAFFVLILYSGSNR